MVGRRVHALGRGLQAVTRGALALLAVLAAEVAGARADDLPGVDRLGWPASTQSLAARGRRATIYTAPARRQAIGELRKDARLAWTDVVAGDRRCPLWLVLTPRGAVCAKDVRPSDDPPLDPELSLGPYADVRGDQVDVFATQADVRAGVPTGTIPGTTFVAIRAKSLKVGGVRYLETDQGYLPERALSLRTPSGWVGFDPSQAPPPAWPFAWVVPARRGEPIDVVAAPARRAAVVEQLAPRTVVAVFEASGRWTRIGADRWVETARLRIARQSAAPAGVAADARWIDVDLDQQVLIAYEGATPVYATLVSTGRKKWRTPIGVYRVREKAERRRMRSPDGARAHWDVAEVPWSMGFRKNFALHGAYWHDGFGTPRSHGCVNLSPADAARLFDFVGPEVPAGWATRAALADDPADLATGTPVRIRDRRHPEPPWRGYHGERTTP